jgi:hypothetical protein
MTDIKDLKSPFFSTYIIAGYDCIPRPVPITTPTKYIGGYTTLNLPSPFTNYSIGDSSAPDRLYCFKDDPIPFATWGDGDPPERNTLHIYGDYGIHDYAKILLDEGLDHDYEVVYGADHYRAIIDIVYSDIYLNHVDRNVKPEFPNNWIIAECIGDKTESFKLLGLIKQMEHFLTDEQVDLLHRWITYEKDCIIHGVY